MVSLYEKKKIIHEDVKSDGTKRPPMEHLKDYYYDYYYYYYYYYYLFILFVLFEMTTKFEKMVFAMYQRSTIEATVDKKLRNN